MPRHEHGFVNDIDNIGINAPMPGMVGMTICRALLSGTNPDTLANDIYNASTAIQGNSRGISLLQAKMEIVYAVADLCPAAA